jgi:hypothetical protein
VKVRDAVAPEVSRNVTVHVHVLDWVPVSLESTWGLRVIEVSELTVTPAFHLLSPLFQVLVPLSGPLQVNVTCVTLVKLVPVASSLATRVDSLVVILGGRKSVKVRRDPSFWRKAVRVAVSVMLWVQDSLL